MTGTPSKDRAEARRTDASDLLHYLDAMPSDGNIEAVVSALDKAFAEGMKRAAEIAQEPFITGNQDAVEACVDFMEAWEMGTGDAIDGIVKCILSEAEAR